VQECCNKVWLACAIDSEGSIQVQRQTRSAKGNNSGNSYLVRVAVYNTNSAYLKKVEEALGSLGVKSRRVDHTSSPRKKTLIGITVTTIDDNIKLLTAVIDQLVVKREIAEGALALILMRKASIAVGNMVTPWTPMEQAFAEQLRSKFMPNSRAYGGILTAVKLRTIPSEASGSIVGTEEPLEHTATSNASSNWPQECPASQWDEDVCRSSGEPESGDNNLREDITAR